jgi:hypothetical protein
MKTRILLIVTLTNLQISIQTLAQAPASFNYQAILRDASGNVKA